MFFKRRSYIELAKKKVLLPIYWDFRGSEYAPIPKKSERQSLELEGLEARDDVFDQFDYLASKPRGEIRVRLDRSRPSEVALMR